MREFTANKTSNAAAGSEKLAMSLGLKEDDTQQQTAADIYTKIKLARKQLRQVKAQAAELRDDHLAETAKFAASLHNMATESAIAAIRAREKSSRQFRQLRSILRTSTSAGLERIDVPNSNAVLRQGEQIPRIPLVTKEEIEEVLVPHTERRFTQHQETPFGHGYRQRALGVDCTSTDAGALRTGTYDYKPAQTHQRSEAVARGAKNQGLCPTCKRAHIMRHLHTRRDRWLVENARKHIVGTGGSLRPLQDGVRRRTTPRRSPRLHSEARGDIRKDVDPSTETRIRPAAVEPLYRHNFGKNTRKANHRETPHHYALRSRLQFRPQADLGKKTRPER